MKNIKDITISIFAIIGFAFVLSSFTTNETEETTQQVYGTPESHVWEFHLSDPADNSDGMAFSINKVTGEVRKYNSTRASFAPPGKEYYAGYRVTEAK